MTPWLARVRHDLVKRLCWPARDRRDLGGPVAPGELVAQLVDAEGRPATAEGVWRELRVGSPAGADLAGFERALEAATQAAVRGEIAGVLALEAAFDALARSVEGET